MMYVFHIFPFYRSELCYEKTRNGEVQVSKFGLESSARLKPNRTWQAVSQDISLGALIFC